MTTQVSGGWVAGSSPKVLQVTNRELCRKLAWTKECGGSALDAAKQTKSFAFGSLTFQPYVRQASSGRKDVCIEVYRPHCVVVDIDLPRYTRSTMVGSWSTTAKSNAMRTASPSEPKKTGIMLVLFLQATLSRASHCPLTRHLLPPMMHDADMDVPRASQSNRPQQPRTRQLGSVLKMAGHGQEASLLKLLGPVVGEVYPYFPTYTYVCMTSSNQTYYIGVHPLHLEIPTIARRDPVCWQFLGKMVVAPSHAHQRDRSLAVDGDGCGVVLTGRPRGAPDQRLSTPAFSPHG